MIAVVTAGVLLLGLLTMAVAGRSEAVPAGAGAIGLLVVQTTTPIALLVTVVLVLRRR